MTVHVHPSAVRSAGRPAAMHAALVVIPAAMGLAAAVAAQPYAITWSNLDGSATTAAMTGGPYAIVGTAGQPDAGRHAAAPYDVTGGFWAVDSTGQPGGCYPNCDGSTSVPLLTPADFICFLQRFRAGDAYANCDGSTVVPTLTPADFVCFLQRFRAGC